MSAGDFAGTQSIMEDFIDRLRHLPEYVQREVRSALSHQLILETRATGYRFLAKRITNFTVKPLRRDKKGNLIAEFRGPDVVESVVVKDFEPRAFVKLVYSLGLQFHDTRHADLVIAYLHAEVAKLRKASV